MDELGTTLFAGSMNILGFLAAAAAAEATQNVLVGLAVAVVGFAGPWAVVFWHTRRHCRRDTERMIAFLRESRG